MKKFSILITTKNRLPDLIITLNKISNLLERNDVNCLICDDGSNDGTFEYIKVNFPNIILFQNQKSKGLIYSRNLLLNATQATFAISLDDDAHFLSENPLELIDDYFNNYPKCGVISFRVFWNLKPPEKESTNCVSERTKGFVGCGHCWRMQSWQSIPNYPDWFIFYGEEEFAAFQLFKIQLEVHYLPTILVHHRVDVMSRKKNIDYQLRQRRSFRSGWYLFLLFYPLKVIPKKLVYTLWIQLKTKTCRGDFKATLGIIQAIWDVLINLPKLFKKSNRFSNSEYLEIEQLKPTNIYWKP
jgi:glycosyltransferase involved in cell wall biosynthesis